MRRFFLLGVVFAAGFLAGMVVTSRLSGDGMAQLTISNRAAQPLQSVCVTEERWHFRYCLDGPLSPGSSSVMPVPARGKAGYKLEIRFSDGRQLDQEFYAEAGYRVEHPISESKIGYEPHLY